MKHLILTALLFTPLAAPHAGRSLPEVPNFSKFCNEMFPSLGKQGVLTSNAWN